MDDFLKLKGDIGYLNDENYSKHPFWDWVSDNFSQTYVIIGNHELYKYTDLAKISNGLVLSIRSNVNLYYNDGLNSFVLSVSEGMGNRGTPCFGVL
jgi:hypothetical protein